MSWNTSIPCPILSPVTASITCSRRRISISWCASCVALFGVEGSSSCRQKSSEKADLQKVFETYSIDRLMRFLGCNFGLCHLNMSYQPSQNALTSLRHCASEKCVGDGALVIKPYYHVPHQEKGILLIVVN